MYFFGKRYSLSCSWNLHRCFSPGRKTVMKVREKKRPVFRLAEDDLGSSGGEGVTRNFIYCTTKSNINCIILLSCEDVKLITKFHFPLILFPQFSSY